MSRAHVIELLKARKKIESEECHFICDALMTYNTSWTPAAREVKDAIDVALNGQWHVANWLRTMGIRDVGSNFSPEMRAYRIRWIDHMIEYWRDK